jgi:hypothetical protein
LIQLSALRGRVAKPLLGLRAVMGQRFDFGRQRRDLARGRAAIVLLEDELAGARRVGEDDALDDPRHERRRPMFGQAMRRFSRDDGARGTAIENKAGQGSGRKTRASAIRVSISADAQPSNGDGCVGINVRSAASSAERNEAATRGGPSMMT